MTGRLRKPRQYPEEAECRALMHWVGLNRKRLPELDLLFHIPNGGKRNPREAARLKAIGVKAGVFDYLLPVVTRHYDGDDYSGLWLEIKAGKGKLTTKQAEWGVAMKREGYQAAVCYSWRDAVQAIEFYLSGDERSF
jgi:hypothetical protein